MEYIYFGIASLEKSVNNVNDHQIRMNRLWYILEYLCSSGNNFQPQKNWIRIPLILFVIPPPFLQIFLPYLYINFVGHQSKVCGCNWKWLFLFPYVPTHLSKPEKCGIDDALHLSVYLPYFSGHSLTHWGWSCTHIFLLVRLSPPSYFIFLKN